jgi:hypothetical protein
LIPAAVACLLLVVRTQLEDRTLQNELEGYKGSPVKVPFSCSKRLLCSGLGEFSAFR